MSTLRMLISTAADQSVIRPYTDEGVGADALPAAPVAGGPLAGGTCSPGPHKFRTTFVYKGGESRLGPASGAITCTATNGTIPVSSIQTGDDECIGRNLYMSEAGYKTIASGRSDYYLAKTITDNTTTEASISVSDAQLNILYPSLPFSDDPNNYSSFVGAGVTLPYPIKGTDASVHMYSDEGSTSSGQVEVSDMPLGPWTLQAAASTNLTAVGVVVLVPFGTANFVRVNFTAISAGAVRANLTRVAEQA